ncbi:hypothetical protein DL96DRAFT_1634571 [Flagelloscypha sp. PMI_526]|nr:hypothetical protein DL96DRAFT_1634457 [Flagelloscypha sp. PMI_526]KAH8801917.1 hypothetical protein DL96DRAFT_1634571 [Flagelloscypha sp. PMI_526]
MPTSPLDRGTGALFLGLELAVDQLRASLVDESLELVAVESVDFDRELPEYQTHGGIFTTPGEAYTTPIEMWIKALDILLQKLTTTNLVPRIKAIGGSAQHALVFWRSTAVPSLNSLDPSLPLAALFNANLFSLPNPSISQDTSAHPHAMAIEALLGGPDHMAQRVGICAESSMAAAQLLRIRETYPNDVWARTGRVQLACNFLATLIAGKWIQMSETEAVATGMWVHKPTHGGGLPVGGNWDEGVLDIIGGSREEGRRVRGWLGEVDTSPDRGGRKVGNVSRYLVERYGFDPETVVAGFTTDHLASYLSLVPSGGDAVLAFGPMDLLLTPALHWIPTRLYTLFPHPAQDVREEGGKRRYICVLSSRNADIPRALVRDMYTKSWSAFDRLVAIVPPGGSIGLDDKLFSFYHLQPESYPFSHVKGIFRFETGIKVQEFRDLRANPRCLIESQVMSFRVRWSRLISTGVLGINQGRPLNRTVNASSPSPQQQQERQHHHQKKKGGQWGMSFDPYDHLPLPARLITTGATANFPSIASLLADVFNANVYIPNTQLDSAQVMAAAHRNAPSPGFPSRASLGCAYLGRWVWGREKGTVGPGGFEDEMRRLFGRRWVKSGKAIVRSNVNGVMSSSLLAASKEDLTLGAIGGGLGGIGVGMMGGTGSGRNTPRSVSGLGHSVLVEEEEEDENGGSPGGLSPLPVIGSRGTSPTGSLHSSTHGHTTHSLSRDTALGPVPRIGAGFYGGGAYELNPAAPGVRSRTTPTSSTPNTTSDTPTFDSSSTAQTSPDPATPTPLAPVTALHTSDGEAQIGLVKVAESDLDGFLGYAAIVPEYCRLEGMLVKGVVG